MRGAALLLALASCAAPAMSHDSWLQASGRGLAFSTGDRYPLAESAPPVSSIAEAACIDARGRRLRLKARELHERATLLGGARAVRGALSCWATIREHEITLDDDKVAVYLREIRPGNAVQERWAQLREVGLPWRERYSKHARIEVGAGSGRVLGLPLGIVPEGEGFRVLAHGQPVPGLSVELVSDKSRFGVWSVADVEGRLRPTIPFGGPWLLRATLLEADGEGWKSRFATLAFERR